MMRRRRVNREGDRVVKKQLKNAGNEYCQDGLLFLAFDRVGRKNLTPSRNEKLEMLRVHLRSQNKRL